MFDAIYETQKRLDLAEDKKRRWKPYSSAIMITGSVAYGRNHSVRSDSDLDLIVIGSDLKKVIPELKLDNEDKKNLKNRFFDGYSVKEFESGIPISIHILSENTFDVICKSYVSDIRVFRPDGKDGSYKLLGFDGLEYEYVIKNVELTEMKGYRTIVPVSFINNDRYFIGIHRDKFLSNPRFLYGDDFILSNLDILWSNLVENMVDESIRISGKLDFDRFNILNCLAKKDRMSNSVKSAILRNQHSTYSRIK